MKITLGFIVSWAASIALGFALWFAYRLFSAGMPTPEWCLMSAAVLAIALGQWKQPPTK